MVGKTTRSFGLACVLLFAVPGLLAATAGPSGATAVAGAAGPATPGYWLAGADGGVFGFGAPFLGSGIPTLTSDACTFTPQPPSTQNGLLGCVGITSDPDGHGYWLLNSFRGATPFGSASLNPATCTSLNGAAGQWSGMAVASNGLGFWLVSSNGGVIGCGSMPAPVGGTSNVALAAPIVAIAATPDRGGYWLAGADGGVFGFGDAAFHGSAAALHLTRPIVGIAATSDGRGYWLVAADGGIFAFGDATYQGSLGGLRLDAPVVGMTPNPDGPGYWLAAADGGVFGLGGAPYEGSMGGRPLAAPIVGIAATAGG